MKKINFKNQLTKALGCAVLVIAGTSASYAQPEVNFAKFDVQCFDDYTVVEWLLEYEENVMFYRLQRSNNEIDWTTIELIEELPGNTDVLYSYTDNEPYSADVGYVYYRLVAYDYYGNSVIHESEEAQCERGSDNPIVIVSPNPTTGTVIIDKPIGGTIDNYTVTNRMGQVVHKGQLRHEKSIIDLDGCDEGMYLIFIGESKRPVRIWKK